MEMVSTSYFDNGRALVASKQLDPKLIDQAVRNILRVKFRLGLFDGRALPAVPPAAEVARCSEATGGGEPGSAQEREQRIAAGEGRGARRRDRAASG